MNKKVVLKELLDKFETEEMRLYCEDMIENIPDYIFTMPSSTSGKFHNKTQCQVYGQLYHIIMFGSIMNYLLALKCNKERFPDKKQRDAMRCVPIFHDAIKCGWDGSQYTVHEHPMLAGAWVRETTVEHNIDDDTKEIIARMCERHSGEWTSSKRSQVIMPEPENEMEILCHECDILSSRTDIDMQPSDYLKCVLEEEVKQDLPDLNTYVINFGRHSGRKIIDVWGTDKNYLLWCKENVHREPLQSLIKQLEEQDKKASEDDEI